MANLFRRHRIFILSIIFLSILFLIFYPSKYISIDENQYLANSYRLLTNEVQSDCHDINNYPGLHFAPNHTCVSKYNLGASLIIFPVVFVGENYVFVIVFTAFILSAFFFYKILLELKVEKFFIVFYIFYPPFIYFSRTVFSEIFSILFINIFLYTFLENKNNLRVKNYITGGVIGIATLVRYTNLIIFASFLLLYTLKEHKFKKAFSIALGALPFGILIMILNKLLYGSFFASGYSLSGEEVFSLGNLGINMPKYLILLTAIYPLMFIALFISKYKNKLLMIAPSVLILILYSLYPYNFFEGRIIDFIVAGRVLIPIIPFLLISYLYVLNNKISIRLKAFIAFILILSTLIVIFFHQKYLNESSVQWKSPTEYYLQSNS